MEKHAVLVVSFGTSYPETLEKTIAAIEREVGAAFPGWALRRAFTSGIIIRKWHTRDGVCIDTVEGALTKLCNEEFTHVVVQPTHIICGDEYEKMLAQLAPFSAQLTLKVGRPLLTQVCDYTAVAAALMEAVPPPAEDEAIVWMGHGTEHHANAAYAQMEYILQDLGWKRSFMGTVEGYPALEQVKSRLQEHPEVRRVRLYPFMIVAGDHAVNDMAGDEDDAWQAQLTAAGYAVTCEIKGLGEYPGVREVIVQHARAAQ